MPIAFVSRDHSAPGARANQLWSKIPTNQRPTWCIYMVNAARNGFEAWPGGTAPNANTVTNNHGVIYCHGEYAVNEAEQVLRSSDLSVYDQGTNYEFDVDLYVQAIQNGVGQNFNTLNLCACYSGITQNGHVAPIQTISNIRQGLTVQGSTTKILGLTIGSFLDWVPNRQGWNNF